ncbi:C4-dicarboxylate ABC transporter [Nitrosomonas sp.]|jgi:hypothetical protein|uniref:C4-dicarboxylate ABC transporter n=1 Tax=Nitrosomonas sp. TaxID=42353 RepID=UPI0025D38344|nr:C4-dicarboxylate ABC transporter [Nitrosomonas sp.]MBS0587004.1 C4-dicarboxylate ABC transporter [Pseudomonadota bacterium]MBV6446857.1 hypothetical protein [Nitrosomonas sp.]
MKNNQVLIFSAVIFGIAFYNIALSFELPESMVGWVLSDIILVFYLSYLLDTFIRGSIKTRMQ